MQSNKRAKREAKRLFRLCLTGGRLDEVLLGQTVHGAAAGGRRNRLGILAHLLRLVRLEHAQHTAAVESAAPLAADLKTELEAALTHRFGQGLATEFTVSPPLIGGVRIQVGSDVYDASVRASLETLERSF